MLIVSLLWTLPIVENGSLGFSFDRVYRILVACGRRSNHIRAGLHCPATGA
jgi:hypothetical protein